MSNDKNKNVIDNIIVNNHSLLGKTPGGATVYNPPFTQFVDYDNLTEQGKERSKTPGKTPSLPHRPDHHQNGQTTPDRQSGVV